MLEYEIFLFQKWKKGRYIRSYISDSQYKSIDNIEIYVNIVAS